MIVMCKNGIETRKEKGERRKRKGQQADSSLVKPPFFDFLIFASLPSFFIIFSLIKIIAILNELY
jgi:hypothetical protein